MPTTRRILLKSSSQLCLFFALIFALVVGLNSLVSKETFAVLSSCTATVSPDSINTNTAQRFTITMGSITSIRWIKITRPSSEFTIMGAATSGWAPSIQSTDVTFTGQNGSTTFYVDAASGNNEAASANWTVQASDDSEGASPTTCTGSLGTAISGVGADTTGPVISSLNVSEITDTAAKVTWTTDENSNSTVEYGTTDSYGSSTSDGTMTTSHTINLSSLSKNTTYHFIVKSTDPSGNTAQSDDVTLVTAKDAISTGTSNAATVTTTKTVTQTLKDAAVPTTVIKTDFSKPFEKAPTITGTASDNSGISKIEYSLDEGKNWQPVDVIGAQFAKSTTFEFTPFGLDDGNYKVLVRSFDPTGNAGKSNLETLIIDRLPPQVGNSILTSGPQIITPKEDGKIYLLAGLEYRMTLSSVGGTTDIKLKAEGNNNSKEFSFSKNVETGLWSSSLSFGDEGEYAFVATSIDGGANITKRNIGNVVVMPSGVVARLGQKQSRESLVTVMVYEPSQQKYVQWDGAYFDQNNPIRTNSDGKFNLFLPSGKYYLQIKAGGQATQKSEIFEFQSSTFVNPQITLDSANYLKIGPLILPLPSFLQKPIKIDLQQDFGSGAVEINKELPVVSLSKGNDVVSTLDLRGKPTIITVISNWSGFDSNQLNILDKTARENPTVNFVPVLSQEKPSLAVILAKKLHLTLPIYADPDGLLTEPLGVNNLPSHFFVTRNGTIKKAVYGILDKEELLSNIIN